jgi:DNA-binding transcriptional ArsR family regulator
MQSVFYVEVAEQAESLFHPLRVEVLKLLSEPRSCPEIAKKLGETTQKVYYHVKILEEAGLIDKVDERRVRGIMEGLYQARARSYWLSPSLVGRVGGPDRARDQMSLGFLLTLAEEIQRDIAHLVKRAGDEIPSLGISGRIHLADRGQRAAFLAELTQIFKQLATKYGRAEADAASESFKVSLVCYPEEEQ